MRKRSLPVILSALIKTGPGGEGPLLLYAEEKFRFARQAFVRFATINIAALKLEDRFSV
jgi:hypothetical protein